MIVDKGNEGIGVRDVISITIILNFMWESHVLYMPESSNCAKLPSQAVLVAARPLL